MHVRASSLIGIAAFAGLVAACGGDGGTDPPPQTTTGTVNGTVTSNGAGVSGATVTLAGKGAVTTGSAGAYTFTQVNAGTHTITLTVPDDQELAGTETAEKSVAVTAGQTATINWTLAPKAPQTATTDTIRLSGTTFSPSSLTVKVGSTIVWVNTQNIFHTVTPNGHSKWSRTETSSTGEVLRVTINEAGTFDYFCEPHQSQGMTGRLVVQQ
jgi:plastocyanin